MRLEYKLKTKVMKEQLVSYKTVKLAQKKGIEFRGPIFSSWVNASNKAGTYHAYVPQSALQKYLREVHNIDVFINRDKIFKKESYCIFIYDNIKDISGLRSLDNDVFSGYFTYEEALETGLQEALKLI